MSKEMFYIVKLLIYTLTFMYIAFVIFDNQDIKHRNIKAIVFIIISLLLLNIDRITNLFLNIG